MPVFPDLPLPTRPGVYLHAEDVPLPRLDAARLSAWIADVVAGYEHELGEVYCTFCSDAHLHRINVNHLDHDTYTDIITFPTAEAPVVGADIFISTERVRENAATFGATFERELYRVIIHGVLHLCGLSDKGAAAAAGMRRAEEAALDRLTAHGLHTEIP